VEMRRSRVRVIDVAVSITTVPAATNIGVALALGQADDAIASPQMLLVNVTGLLGAGLFAFALARHLPFLRANGGSVR
jgi:hypothetical protein